MSTLLSLEAQDLRFARGRASVRIEAGVRSPKPKLPQQIAISQNLHRSVGPTRCGKSKSIIRTYQLPLTRQRPIQLAYDLSSLSSVDKLKLCCNLGRLQAISDSQSRTGLNRYSRISVQIKFRYDTESIQFQSDLTTCPKSLPNLTMKTNSTT